MKNKFTNPSWLRGFQQGFACAAALVMKQHGDAIIVQDLLPCAGLTSLKELSKYGVDEGDVKVLAPIIKEMTAQKRRAKRLMKEVNK